MKTARIFALIAFLVLLYLMLTFHFSQQDGNIEEVPYKQAPTEQLEEVPANSEIQNEPSEPIIDSLPADNQSVEIAEDSATSERKLSEPKEEINAPTLSSNTLKVSKKEGEIAYQLNGQASDNLMADIAGLDLEKDFFIKFSGNITYAEEKQIREMLDAKGLNYTVAEN